MLLHRHLSSFLCNKINQNILIKVKEAVSNASNFAFKTAPCGILEFLWLKGCAERVPRGGRVVRSYCNLVCRAVSITIVIVAILYVALDAFDMLTAAILVLFHFHFSFPLAVFCKRLCAFAVFSLYTPLHFYTV